jgi:hypothetical protein
MSQPATAPTPAKAWYKILDVIVVRILLPFSALAATITFGVWAIYSYELAQKESCRAHPVSKLGSA